MATAKPMLMPMVLTVVLTIIMCIGSNVFIPHVNAHVQYVDDKEQQQQHLLQQPFLCVISRVHNEPRKVQSFIPHYLYEGFDKILLIDDRSEPPVQSTHPAVQVIREDTAENPQQHFILKKHIQTEFRNCSWVASVDIDELLTTRRHVHSTVREELLESMHYNKDVYAINVPWIFFAYDKPVDNMALDMTCRWNHSRHHHGLSTKTRDRYGVIESKPLFRPQYCHLHFHVHCVICEDEEWWWVKEWQMHQKDPTLPWGNKDLSYGQVEGVYGNGPHKCNIYGFHEEEIQQALFAIHHYRFLDIDDIRKKCMPKNMFKNSQYATKDCEEAMTKSNYCEVRDDIMHVKYGKNGAAAAAAAADADAAAAVHINTHSAPRYDATVIVIIVMMIVTMMMMLAVMTTMKIKRIMRVIMIIMLGVILLMITMIMKIYVVKEEQSHAIPTMVPLKAMKV